MLQTPTYSSCWACRRPMQTCWRCRWSGSACCRRAWWGHPTPASRRSSMHWSTPRWADACPCAFMSALLRSRVKWALWGLTLSCSTQPETSAAAAQQPPVLQRHHVCCSARPPWHWPRCYSCPHIPRHTACCAGVGCVAQDQHHGGHAAGRLHVWGRTSGAVRHTRRGGQAVSGVGPLVRE